jgi:regulator of replication initiation timing
MRSLILLLVVLVIGTGYSSYTVWSKHKASKAIKQEISHLTEENLQLKSANAKLQLQISHRQGEAPPVATFGEPQSAQFHPAN